MPSSLSLAGGPTRATRVQAPAWRQPFRPPRSGTRFGALRATFQLSSGPARPCDRPLLRVCPSPWSGTTPNTGKSPASEPTRAVYSQVSPGRDEKLDPCQTNTIVVNANYSCLAGEDGRGAAGRSAGYSDGTWCGSDAGTGLVHRIPCTRLRDIPNVMDGLSPDPSPAPAGSFAPAGPFSWRHCKRQRRRHAKGATVRRQAAGLPGAFAVLRRQRSVMEDTEGPHPWRTSP
jgi:hypothetical protein